MLLCVCRIHWGRVRYGALLITRTLLPFVVCSRVAGAPPGQESLLRKGRWPERAHPRGPAADTDGVLRVEALGDHHVGH